MKQPLAKLVRWAENVPLGRPVLSLSALKPLIAPEAFSGNVVLVNNALAWGGAERQVVTLLHALEKRGQPSGLLCLRLDETKDSDFYLEMLKGYQGFVRNACALDEANVVLTDLSPEQRDNITAALQWMPADVQNDIYRFVAEFLVLRPRAVHAWQDSVSVAIGYAARIVGVPRIVISARNVNPTNFAYYRPYMFIAYRQLAECSSIRMVNNSEAGALDYASWLHIERERFEVHRNGIDTSIFQTAEFERVKALRSKLGIPDGAPVIASIFRFYAEKDPHLWMDMAKRVAVERPDVHFVVFGVGPMKPAIEAIAGEYGLAERLHLPGTTQEPNLAIGLFDVFVLTSRFEGTPNVLIEATMLGVPVVVTAAGGAAEVIEVGETGLVARGRDAGVLAGMVLAVLSDPAWPSRARMRGPAFISEKFGVERMVEEALSYYGPVGAKPRI